MSLPHSWTDGKGVIHFLPSIDYRIEKRLKQWGLLDLYSATTRPEKWEDLFSGLAGDSELIVNLCYALEHKDRGTVEQQEAYADLFCGDEKRNSTDIIKEASEALIGAVVDFFPSETRESTRQWVSLYLTHQSLESFRTVAGLGGSFSETPENGLSGSLELSEAMEKVSASAKSANDMMESSTMSG